MALLTPLSFNEADDEARRAQHARVRDVILTILGAEGPPVDWISAQATAACELHAAFDYFHWTGFYRAVTEDTLVIGPYQGGHGCLRIPFDRGVCGAAARERRSQLVADVEVFPGHIACASSTRSELVVPVLTPAGRLLGVLDIDSDLPSAFTEADQEGLEALCESLGERYPEDRL